MKTITIISGSYALSSRLNGLIEFIESYYNERINLNIIHVHQLSSKALITADYKDPSILQANKLVEESQGIIVATPTFKAAYSGILKTYLDLLPQHVFDNKVVLPLAIGGSPAHLLVLKYALEPVLSELGAQHIIHGVFVLDSHIKRKDGKGFEIDAHTVKRLNPALDQLLIQLKIDRISISG
ncbi:NADPH-dependent FMN reductase [Terrilactibacillus sp. BCM23-1]|uniref:NADPH-dependent FMN reductase n=1 Tax=Terrilactibacillus tamarindi TaxID=2599694 RepID=A0A6N8CQ76_9BACI|nr:NADPH-dependent FMN reductase [Terrilactibacillus tamarindi]MTT32349.1 NADPH-dependent FMN reductase [Terrilactibacillus tamarindi]